MNNFRLNICFLSLLVLGGVLLCLSTLNSSGQNYSRLAWQVGISVPIQSGLRQSANIKKDIYLQKTIIFKIKQDYRKICKTTIINDDNLESFFNAIQIKSLKKIFPKIKALKSNFNKFQEPLVDLSLIYEIEYEASTSIYKAINYLKSLNIIEYAQPHYLPELLYTPDDPLNINQYYLDTIKAYDAWEICQGDSNIVIGITDTGVDIDHEDLQDNIYYNYNDPINGIDDDNDGFIDNFRGWDLGENDNNPQWEINNHGVIVTGIAGARTDNGIGISGVGFKSKFLPVKISKIISDNTLVLPMAYEGIVYAADMGCDVINCSWGGHSKHPYGQDIINYATFNKNVLIIAAAGNDNNESLLYPASYDNVISVGGTNESDIRASFDWNGNIVGSNYNYYVDVCAPSFYIYSTQNDSYITCQQGWTSFASPIVAGCAAIVKAHYGDTLSALQIGEILKATADNIDTIPENIVYAEKLGSGRINLYRALTDILPPSVKFSNIIFYDNDDNHFFANDTIYIQGTYKNYLSPTSNLSVNISSESPYIEIINNINAIGVLGTLETFNNDSNPFSLKLLPSIPYNETIVLKLTFTDDNYYAVQFISFIANTTFINIDTNNIATTITSIGRIGYNDFNQNNGIGFTYKNSRTLLYEAGLLIGNSIDKVSNCIRASIDSADNDFYILSRAQKIEPPVISDFDILTIFNDDNADTNKLNIEVIQNVFAWNTEYDANYVIIEYNIINKNNFTIDNLYAGIFADWDIMNFQMNKISFNENLNLSYSYTTETNGIYTGIKLLTNTPVNHFAIDNVAGGGGDYGVDITDGFSINEKYYVISRNRHNAGGSENGNDIIDVLSTGPLSINENDTLKIAFALLAGENLYVLENIANSAQQKYDSLFSSNSKHISYKDFSFNIYPNPAYNSATINFYLPEKNHIEIYIINNIGERIKTLVQSKLGKGMYNYNIDTSKLNNGIYYVQFKSDNCLVTRKIVLIK